MSEKKKSFLFLVWGWIIVLVANIAVIGVTIWEDKTSTDNDLWFSNTFAVVIGVSFVLAFFVALPLNFAAVLSYWKCKNDSKVVLAIIGMCLSFLTWIMPVIVERMLHISWQ